MSQKKRTTDHLTVTCERQLQYIIIYTANLEEEGGGNTAVDSWESNQLDRVVEVAVDLLPAHAEFGGALGLGVLEVVHQDEDHSTTLVGRTIIYNASPIALRVHADFEVDNVFRGSNRDCPPLTRD